MRETSTRVNLEAILKQVECVPVFAHLPEYALRAQYHRRSIIFMKTSDGFNLIQFFLLISPYWLHFPCLWHFVVKHGTFRGLNYWLGCSLFPSSANRVIQTSHMASPMQRCMIPQYSAVIYHLMN